MLAALLVVKAGLGAAAPAGERPLARRALTALPVSPAPGGNGGGRAEGELQQGNRLVGAQHPGRPAVSSSLGVHLRAHTSHLVCRT